MHELGLVFQMAKVVEESLAGEENITAIDTVVVEIGEISSVVPHYFVRGGQAGHRKNPRCGPLQELRNPVPRGGARGLLPRLRQL